MTTHRAPADATASIPPKPISINCGLGTSASPVDVAGISRQSTIPGMLAETIERCGDRDAIGWIVAGRLQWMSWRELGERVAGAVESLQAAQVEPGDRVAHWGANSLGWIIADLAIQCAGAVHVPLHAALPVAAATGMIAHSGSRLTLCAEAASAFRLAESLPDGYEAAIRDDLLGWDAPPGAPPARLSLRAAAASASPDDLATILYTSGTTGDPRGVMLAQRQLAANVVAVSLAAAQPADEIRLCVLPLSHIYARTCDLYSWVCRGTRMVLAASRETIVRDAQLAHPTVISAVPYLYQKLAATVRTRPAHQRGEALRELLGGSIKRLKAGGAGMPPEVERLFEEAGLPVLSGYGLTETAPVVSMSTPETYAPGTVGRPLPNLEVRLAEDGEVLVRGPSVMSGYWDNVAATRDAIDSEGWLHTGDLGAWHASGNLQITGRKKEMIVLATGKNAAPTQIEQQLVGSPLIEQACVVGDGRNFLAGLIVPNPETLQAEIRRRRLIVWSRRRAVTHPRIRQLYRGEIDRCLAGFAPHEQIGQFVLLSRGFSIEEDEMTLKLSLRRETIELHFAREIERMYRQRR